MDGRIDVDLAHHACAALRLRQLHLHADDCCGCKRQRSRNKRYVNETFLVSSWRWPSANRGPTGKLLSGAPLKELWACQHIKNIQLVSAARFSFSNFFFVRMTKTRKLGKFFVFCQKSYRKFSFNSNCFPPFPSYFFLYSYLWAEIMRRSRCKSGFSLGEFVRFRDKITPHREILVAYAARNLLRTCI